jgi:organic radical activating enzyme
MPQLSVLAESIVGRDRAMHGVVLTGGNPRHLMDAHRLLADAHRLLAASPT